MPPPALADSFDPNANGFVYVNRGAGGRQDFSGRRFHAASADRRAIASPGSMPPPAWRIRSTRTRTIICLFNRGAGGRQDSSGRRFHDSIGGQTRNRIARLDATTGLADSFNPNANSSCLFNRGAGGRQDFSGRRFHGSIGGQTRNRIARLDATTGLADSFNPNANGAVYSIAVQADGKILAGGDFTQHRRTDAQPHRPARCHDRPG